MALLVRDRAPKMHSLNRDPYTCFSTDIPGKDPHPLVALLVRGSASLGTGCRARALAQQPDEVEVLLHEAVGHRADGQPLA